MTNKNKKRTEKDFDLLSSKVKVRVKNLIDKRLTSQTIMLFAQEYETYDAEVREQLIDYINFLMEIEREKWMNESNYLYEKQNVQNLTTIKQSDFYQRQEEIKKFQEYLTKDRTSATQKAIENSRKETLIKKPEITNVEKTNQNKNVVSIEKNSINKMLLEAKIREEKEAKAAKLREAKKAEEERQKQLAKQKELEKKKKELEKEAKAKKEQKVKKVKKVKTKKSPSPQIIKIDRDYEKEQAEKEKLWKELYGKTRQETISERKTNEEVKETFVEYDKKPSFDSTIELQKSFTILGHEFSIEETTDPKNKYFSFWYGIKKRVKTSNISIWLSINPNKQKSVLRKRLRLEQNMGLWDKIKAIFVAQPQKQQVKKQQVKKKSNNKEKEKNSNKESVK
ncbi:hypothetical protein [Spiroplasma sp. BIUS-1]|uniref:hypothetical protein n=1 Tax=Spiroplasma sp. BIUS-1 TaxID=216964 RepID=UPI001398D1F9|nr:hypothetical protein [Spiroplasma sp. BIUS-1]QHX36557.1 hypothetical protein SBIUS_v1c03040 [Spiroplasma sp. BIUS-1]